MFKVTEEMNETKVRKIKKNKNKLVFRYFKIYLTVQLS